MPQPTPKRTSSEPQWLPVSLTQAKAQLWLPDAGDAHDARLCSLIRAATRVVASDHNLAIQAGMYQIELDAFPLAGWIELPLYDATAIDQISYLASDAPVVLDPADYKFSADRVRPAVWAETWPTADITASAVQIDFQAGAASSGAVPEDVQQLILSIVDSLWNGCAEDGTFGPVHDALSRRQVRSYL